MNKELQDKAWLVLPKEFKEELQFQYQNGSLEKRQEMRDLYGFDNLISDIEEEEILSVSRKEVQEMYSVFEEFKDKDNTCFNLVTLFGSKCLIDKEFKFKIGDKVIFHPFKSDSFYNAEVLEIHENADKPYLLHIEDAENLWAYPIEIQPIDETYNEKIN